MAKKNGKKQGASDVTQAAADATEEQKVEAEDSKVNETTETVVQAAAATVVEEEEQKVDPATTKGPGLQRRNSRIMLQKEEVTGTEKKLFRPEFGETGKTGQEKLWAMMDSYIGTDQRSIQRSIVNHVEYTLARTRFSFDDFGAYQAAAFSVRDRLIEAWNDTQQYHTVSPPFQGVISISHSISRLCFM